MSVLMLTILALPLTASSAFAANNGDSNITNGSLRPVYIISDNINGSEVDNARIESLVSELNKLGITAYNGGVGVNAYSELNSIPNNAVLVEIDGGVDPGYIYDKGTAYYQDILGDKKDFIAITSGETETYTGDYVDNDLNVSWLPRAWDDSYDSSSFTGLANPGEYLLDHGINYFQNLNDGNMDELAQSIYNLATS